jgi:hypothetical protein
MTIAEQAALIASFIACYWLGWLTCLLSVRKKVLD